MLASNLTDSEKFTIWTECEKFIQKDKNLSKKFGTRLLVNWKGDDSVLNDNKIRFFGYYT